MTKPTAINFLLVGKDPKQAGTEDHHFHEFFGAGPFTVTNLWNMMVDRNGLPLEGEIKHLLWSLHFLKAYPKHAAVCLTAGGSTGAIDLEIFPKHMWPFIRAIADQCGK